MNVQMKAYTHHQFSCYVRSNRAAALPLVVSAVAGDRQTHVILGASRRGIVVHGFLTSGLDRVFCTPLQSVLILERNNKAH